ncbi:MAG: spermidine synthase, partial [Thermaurantiacus sp.]
GRMSGVGMGLAAAPSLFGPGARIGFVGLGAGSMACYARPGQQWTAYEIDPAMVRLARDSGAFTFIARCAPTMEIVTGDARLKLAEEPDGRFDMLAVDAFSSDAIPLHLMTREAFQTYLRVLAPDGILLVHISNRYLDLEPVVGRLAASLGLAARGLRHRPGLFEEAAGLAITTSHWVALARDEETLQRFLERTDSADWVPLRDRVDLQPWTDDRASILPVLRSVRDLF